MKGVDESFNVNSPDTIELVCLNSHLYTCSLLQISRERIIFSKKNLPHKLHAGDSYLFLMKIILFYFTLNVPTGMDVAVIISI